MADLVSTNIRLLRSYGRRIDTPSADYRNYEWGCCAETQHLLAVIESAKRGLVDVVLTIAIRTKLRQNEPMTEEPACYQCVHLFAAATNKYKVRFYDVAIPNVPPRLIEPDKIHNFQFCGCCVDREEPFHG
jgi:hypothetical protein